MVIINPFLLSGPAQIEAYQKKRIQDWEKQKGQSRNDFDHYFNNILEQWNLDDFNESMVDISAFEDIDGIDLDLSVLIHNILKSEGILNENGYINLKQPNTELLNNIIDDLLFLDDTQMTELKNLLSSVQQNKPINYNTFTKGMFTFLPSAASLKEFTITEPESNAIWEQLNSKNIIDDYGILLLETNSDELTNAINSLTGISSSQKERVLLLLNKHPELSYSRYIKNFKDQQSLNEDNNKDSNLPGVGIYVAKEVKLKQIEGLSPEELNFIRAISLMEWNVMLISQKTMHKNRKKTDAKIKKQKKDDNLENQKFLAQMEAKYQEEFRKQLKGKKKGK